MHIFEEIKGIQAGFIFIIILIIGIGVITYREINEVYEMGQKNSESFMILNALEGLLAQTSMAEESQRNYFLTNRNIYVEGFYEASTNIDQHFSTLHSIIADTPKTPLLDSLKRMIYIRLESLETKIDLQRKGDRDKALFLLEQSLSSQTMLNIRNLIVSMERHEYKRLSEKNKKIVDVVRNTSVTILIGTVLSCIIFLTTFYMLSREILERKRIEEAVKVESEFSERLLNSSIDGIFAFDKDLRYTLWNPGVEALTGIHKEDALGRVCYDVMPFLKEIGEDKNFHETLRGNYAISKDKWFYVPESGKKGYFEAYYSPIYDRQKKVSGGLGIIRNTTRRKLALEALERTNDLLEKRVQERTAALLKTNEDLRNEVQQRKEAQEKINNSLQEKVVLLREIHHRVKNNLQVISSLLNLQSSYIEDAKALEIFRESQNRVRSMALIHEKLYQSKDLNKVDFSEYIDSLTSDLIRSYNIDRSRIKFKSNVQEILLGVDTAILCGLIINELISNSFKHAFPEDVSGEVAVELSKRESEKYELIVRDNGVGLPEYIDYKNTDSLGLQLVVSLTDQLGGDISLTRNGCTEFKIIFTAV